MLPTRTPPPDRMAWLDALRAIAALLVVYAHLSRYLLVGARAVSAEWLNAGPAGVFLFFLVSGFIIPASLERHGDLRRFWISRMFRLLPLYLVVAVLVVVLGVFQVVPLDPFLAAHPATAVTAHLTMLPFLLGVPLVTPVLWTLTYEMVFYLLVGALFVTGQHRRSGPVAIVLAVVAVATAPLTPVLRGSPAVLTFAVAALLLAGLITGSRAGFVLLGVVAVALLLVNEDPGHVWDGLLIVAVMFTGTTIYRAWQGQIPRWQAALTGAVVASALLINWSAELESLHGLTARYRARAVVTLIVFAGTFALAMGLRRRGVPRWLSWLGTVSYSIYLVHFVLIQVLGRWLTALGNALPGPAELPAVAAYLGLVVGLAALTHRYIELPGQRLGRRLAGSHARRSATALDAPPVDPFRLTRAPCGSSAATRPSGTARPRTATPGAATHRRSR